MGALAQVLRGMPTSSDPNLLVGAEHFDDAGVYRISDETALVLTLDFFPPLVDDPYTFGRIAAANSLSDIYAMGGRAIAALNIVGYPDKDLPIEWLGEILRGGAERVAAAGAVLAGGHSVRDAEVKYGLSVTGVVHPERVFMNGGARPGDVLVLTKPIGSGVLTTAAKQGKIEERELDEAVGVMIELNRGACDVLVGMNGARSPRDADAPIHAVTDITGFGLIGHAFEMADAGGVSITIDARSVPLLKRTMELAGQGVVTRAAKSNLEHLGPRFENRGADETLVRVLADAQTSGGLLIAVAADHADRLVSLLMAARTPCAAVVGKVAASGTAAVLTS